jgi:Transposase DDE domain group 1
MTECNMTTVGFTRLGGRQVVADFLGGRLTSDAGALLLREVDRRIGLVDSMNEVIPDPVVTFQLRLRAGRNLATRTSGRHRIRACKTISDPIGTHHESQPKRSAGGCHGGVLTMQAT